MSSTATQLNVQPLTEDETYNLGIEAYAYFYPLVTMEITRRQSINVEPGKIPGLGPVNHFWPMRSYPDADFKLVVRPNFDTLYTVAWLDLTKEPMIISVPDFQDRYYLLPMLDMWSDVFAVPGWRTTGTKAGCFAVVPEGWTGTLPTEAQRIAAPTPYVWIIGRIKTDGPDDYKSVNSLQDKLVITPLSQWGKPAAPINATIDAGIDRKTPPLDVVNAMPAAQYFQTAAELVKLHRPHLTDWSILARLARIGFVPGQSFDMNALDSKLVKALERGCADGLKQMQHKLPTLGRPANGWNMNTDSMGVYGNYYLKRAIIAMVGLGANQPEDAVYPLNIVDAAGEQLDGSRKYVLRFAKNELPPVDAFWSLTMYDASGFQCANSLNRFAVSSWMPLKTAADGSLTIYIQHEDPGPDKQSNWLPAPAKGTLGMTMRLYAPQLSVLTGDWNPPAIERA